MLAVTAANGFIVFDVSTLVILVEAIHKDLAIIYFSLWVIF